MNEKAQARAKEELFQKTLTGETDRGAALVSAAYLAEELRMLLEKMFIDSPKTNRALFEGAGPLATFSSRINLAFATGLLTGPSHRLFHLIRKIRNDFAHQHLEMSFTDEAIAARCRGLVTMIPRFGQKKPRILFVRAVMYLLAEVHARASKIRRVKVRSIEPVGRDFDYLRTESAMEALTASLTHEERLRFISPDISKGEKMQLVVEMFRRTGTEAGRLTRTSTETEKQD